MAAAPKRVRVNFPNSSVPIVQIRILDADGKELAAGQSGVLTQSGQYLLQALWNEIFNDAQGTYPAPTATAATPVLPDLPGTTLSQVASQVVLLTQLMSSLITDLKNKGTLG